MRETCTIFRTMNFIGKRWTLPIMIEMYKGKEKHKRYTEVKKRIPAITPKVLSARLKELEQEGLISKRTDASSFPIKCEYSLTKSGIEFIDIIKHTKQWALKWKYKNSVCSSQDCKECDL